MQPLHDTDYRTLPRVTEAGGDGVVIARLTDTLWSFDNLIAKIDETAPAKRDPYKKASVKIDNSGGPALEAEN